MQIIQIRINFALSINHNPKLTLFCEIASD
nr:MAG TPA: hypothetical protein [Caudoviricetes sp.]